MFELETLTAEAFQIYGKISYEMSILIIKEISKYPKIFSKEKLPSLHLEIASTIFMNSLHPFSKASGIPIKELLNHFINIWVNVEDIECPTIN